MDCEFSGLLHALLKFYKQGRFFLLALSMCVALKFIQRYICTTSRFCLKRIAPQRHSPYASVECDLPFAEGRLFCVCSSRWEACLLYTPRWASVCSRAYRRLSSVTTSTFRRPCLPARSVSLCPCQVSSLSAAPVSRPGQYSCVLCQVRALSFSPCLPVRSVVRPHSLP